MANKEQSPMVKQVFVKLLNGESRAINFEATSSLITSFSIKLRLSLLTGIPISSQILLSGSRPFNPTNNHAFPLFCTLVVRLRGGKGGFGSLLRGAATKAGQKKTNNFDACRDMSGRRLRHVNAEKRLEEWKAEAEERELEKAAEEFLKKKMKTEGKKKKEGGGVETEKYVSKYREDSARCMEVVEKSVREALGKKKRKVKAGNGGYSSKKLKIWMGKRKVDNSDGDDSEDDNSDDNEEHENGNSIVLDNENHLESLREKEGSSDSVTGGKMDENDLAGGSSGNSSDADEETAIKKTSNIFEISAETMVEETVQQKEELSLLESTAVVPETEAAKNDYVTVGQPRSTSSSGEGETLDCGRIDDKLSSDTVPKPILEEEIVSKSIVVAVAVKPLNFEEFNSSAELEDLGMEKLKLELQSRGLKCGGTLQERAARLFLLKTTPLEKLPKKLLAKK